MEAPRELRSAVDAREDVTVAHREYAGEIAQSTGAEIVREEFVTQARESAETDRFRELIRIP